MIFRTFVEETLISWGQGLVSQVKRYLGQKGSFGGGLDKRPLGGEW